MCHRARSYHRPAYGIAHGPQTTNSQCSGNSHHTGVPDLAHYTQQADIVIAAAGVPNLVTPDMIKPGAAVIGGGLTREGKKILSDVDESVAEVAGWVTPRLGGVGPMTRAMLLKNTVDAAMVSAT